MVLLLIAAGINTKVMPGLWVSCTGVKEQTAVQKPSEVFLGARCADFSESSVLDYVDCEGLHKLSHF